MNYILDMRGIMYISMVRIYFKYVNKGSSLRIDIKNFHFQ